MVKNIQFLNGPPNHVISPFETGQKCQKSQMFGFKYSDGNSPVGIQISDLSSIQMDYLIPIIEWSIN